VTTVENKAPNAIKAPARELNTNRVIVSVFDFFIPTWMAFPAISRGINASKDWDSIFAIIIISDVSYLVW
jgi:hypothetical protein